MDQCRSRGRLGRASAFLVIAASFLYSVAVLQEVAEVLRFDKSNLARSLSPDGGRRESLPREVTEAAEIVARHVEKGVPVALSEELAGDAFMQQRMWEALYPVRFSQERSRYVITRNPGLDVSGCTIVERGTHVLLANCH